MTSMRSRMSVISSKIFVRKDDAMEKVTDQLLERAKSATREKRRLNVSGKFEQAAKDVILKMFWYLIFLFNLTIVGLVGRNNQELFYFSRGVQEAYTTTEVPDEQVLKVYADVAYPEEWYDWIETVFYSVTYEGQTVDASVSSDIRALNGSGTRLSDMNYILGYAPILGAVRVSQLRVQEETCVTPKELTLPDSSCFRQWSSDNEDTSPFGYPDAVYEKVSGLSMSTGKYEPDWSSSITRRTYPAPTFQTVIPSTEDSNLTAKALVGSFRTHHYIDLKTRAVFIDVSCYNPSLDQIAVLRLAVEITQAGGLLPSARINTLRLYQYFKVSDFVRMVGEVTLVCFFLMKLRPIVQALRLSGIYSLFTPYNALEILNLIFFFGSCVVRGFGVLAQPQLDGDNLNADVFYDFRLSSELFRYSQEVFALSMLVSWLSIFNYISFIPGLGVLLVTLSIAGKRIGSFLVISATVFLSSSMAFMLVFGVQLYEYRNLSATFFSLMRMSLGETDFEALYRASPVIGTILFSVFVCLVIFVLLNLVIAIITEAFDQVQETLDENSIDNMRRLVGMMKHVLLYDMVYKIPVIGFLAKRAAHLIEYSAGRVAERLVMEADVNQDGQVSVTEMLAFLEKRYGSNVSKNFAGRILKKFDLDPIQIEGALDFARDPQNGHMVSLSSIRDLLEELEKVREEAEGSVMEKDDEVAAEDGDVVQLFKQMSRQVSRRNISKVNLGPAHGQDGELWDVEDIGTPLGEGIEETSFEGKDDEQEQQGESIGVPRLENELSDMRRKLREIEKKLDRVLSKL